MRSQKCNDDDNNYLRIRNSLHRDTSTPLAKHHTPCLENNTRICISSLSSHASPFLSTPDKHHLIVELIVNLCLVVLLAVKNPEDGEEQVDYV